MQLRMFKVYMVYLILKGHLSNTKNSQSIHKYCPCYGLYNKQSITVAGHNHGSHSQRQKHMYCIKHKQRLQ